MNQVFKNQKNYSTCAKSCVLLQMHFALLSFNVDLTLNQSTTFVSLYTCFHFGNFKYILQLCPNPSEQAIYILLL